MFFHVQIRNFEHFSPIFQKFKYLFYLFYYIFFTEKKCKSVIL
jgi:hypothetical protein